MSTIFFFNDTATTEIYTLSLHDALPIFGRGDASIYVRNTPTTDRKFSAQVRKLAVVPWLALVRARCVSTAVVTHRARTDRKSTRLNSSHSQISYAGFCLNKKQQSDLRFE